MIEERKDWLTNFMEERKRRAQLELPDVYLYGKDTKLVSFNEFVNRELVLFSNMDNERSIPSLCDGTHLPCVMIPTVLFLLLVIKSFSLF